MFATTYLINVYYLFFSVSAAGTHHEMLRWKCIWMICWSWLCLLDYRVCVCVCVCTWLLFSPWLCLLESGKCIWQPVSSITRLMLFPPFPITCECSVCATSIFRVTRLLYRCQKSQFRKTTEHSWKSTRAELKSFNPAPNSKKIAFRYTTT